MMGHEYVKSLVDERYAYLLAYKKLGEPPAKSIIANILTDLFNCYMAGLRVLPVVMNPDGEYSVYSVGDLGVDCEYYYAIFDHSFNVPEIELNEQGILQVYETFDLANDVVVLYNDYFKNNNHKITGY